MRLAINDAVYEVAFTYRLEHGCNDVVLVECATDNDIVETCLAWMDCDEVWSVVAHISDEMSFHIGAACTDIEFRPNGTVQIRLEEWERESPGPDGDDGEPVPVPVPLRRVA